MKAPINTSTSPDPHPASPRDGRPVDGRALVLGGGGSAGNAWELGVVAGLCAAGTDLTEADLIVGTSAGATAAAQLTAAPPAELFARTLDAGPGTHIGRPQATASTAADPVAALQAIIAASDDVADMRRSIGAAARANRAASDGAAAAQARRRAVVAARLPSQVWPQRPVQIVAVDAHTGEPVVFDRHSGVDLADAVTASTANGFSVPPHDIGDRGFLDGGYRAGENADLAAGHGRVLVLAPFGGRTLMPLEWGIHLAAQLAGLRAGGSRVETIFPDAASLAAFGTDMMNPSTRPPAARAGFEQGTACAEHLAEFWR